MKKAIAALLSMFVGIFGYAIVDETIEARVSNLEAAVSSQQEEIESLHHIGKYTPSSTAPTTRNPGVTSQTAVSPETIPDFPVSGMCGDYIKWELTADGKLTISGKGSYYSEWPGYLEYSKYITTAVVENGITRMFNYAFSGCTNLTSVTIGNSVTSIGWLAFSGCTGLTSITIPDSVTSIGGSAFYGCTGLTSITIPNGVTYIGSCAFQDCSGLKSITIPDSVTSIGGWAFYDCTSLETVKLGKNIERIENQTFYNCSELKTVYVGDKITYIDREAFAKCGKLTDVYYAGTEEQWKAINIGESNARLTDAKIHYNSSF